MCGMPCWKYNTRNDDVPLAITAREVTMCDPNFRGKAMDAWHALLERQGPTTTMRLKVIPHAMQRLVAPPPPHVQAHRWTACQAGKANE